MRKLIALLALLVTCPAFGQPGLSTPPRYTVATKPPCADGTPKIIALTNAQATNPCTSASTGTLDILCQCKDGTYSELGIAAGTGTVTSVGLTMPAEFTVSGSPVTTSGSLAAAYASQLQALVFASPAGASGTPSFRALVATDLPGTYAASASAGGPASSVAANSVALTTDTTGNYVSSAATGGGLALVGTEGASLGLLATCADTQILKWSGAPTSAWACAADAGGPTNYAASASPAGPASSVAANSVALGTDTTGGYAASTTEGGAATTATALAANGANCAAGNYPLGVDAAGAVESCTAVAAGGIGGTLGTTDNAIPRADGVGGVTAQGSDLVVDDTAAGVLTVHPITATALTLSTLDNNKDIVLDPHGTGTVQAPGQGTAAVKHVQIGSAALATGTGTSYGSVSIGQSNVAGSGSVASGETSVGHLCQATGQWSSCYGLFNTASGANSAVFGGNSSTASGSGSLVINGQSATASTNNALLINSAGPASANNCGGILAGVCTHAQTLSVLGGATSQAGQVVFGGANGWEVTNFRMYQSANGALREQVANSELITLNTGGTTTDSAANLLPANSHIDAVACRITTTITTATDWSIGDGTVAARFSAANSMLIAGTTSVGMAQLDGAGTSGQIQTTAAKLRITTTGTPGAGAIRCTVFATTFTAPTS